MVLIPDAPAQDSRDSEVVRPYWRASASPTILSSSRQFVVSGRASSGWLPSAGTNGNVARLDPNFLASSCERVKAALNRELGAGDDWRGRITLALHPAIRLGETIEVAGTRFADGWNYQVNLPDAMERSRLITVLVDLLLHERASRGGAANAVEIPGWLSQGLAQQIMRSAYTDLIVEPPTAMESGVHLTRTVRPDWRKDDPLAGANAHLRLRPAPTLQELSWATPEMFEGDAGETYRDAAQLLVSELERLRNGRACLRAFLAETTRHLNWQLAFAAAFQEHFANQREFEKWWEVVLASFTGRDLAHTWSAEESLRKLDEIIRPPVHVRTATNDVPLRTDVTLQTIVREWELLSQSRVLGDKVQQLRLLRNHVSRDLVPVDTENGPERGILPGPRDVLPLVDGYREALESYLNYRSQAGLARRSMVVSLPLVRKRQDEAIRALDALDARKEALKQAAGQAVEAAGMASSAIDAQRLAEDNRK